MKRSINHLCSGAMLVILLGTTGADWRQFRGPTGMGIVEGNIPETWSSEKHVAWRSSLPGPGTATPIIVGEFVYVTCYSGYGIRPSEGEMTRLRRHLVCLDRASGNLIWGKSFEPVLPEHAYQGEGAYHGYASSTPITDGERLYVFFGKSGVFCFDFSGKQLWRVSVGDGIHHWGSACSLILHGDLLIVNSSVESRKLIALDKHTGTNVWSVAGIESSWNTPLIVPVSGQSSELVISIQDWILGMNPDNGEELWRSEGIHRYVCPSVVSNDGIIYAIGGGHTGLAVRSGGRGDVTNSHVLWRKNRGSNVTSPLYYQGKLYWASERNGIAYCQDAATGEFIYQQRMSPQPGLIYASPIRVDDRIYYLSQHGGTYVVRAASEFDLIAHNVFEEDDSRLNASPAVSGDSLYIRTDRFLYCIRK